jgi:hypothetical protein
MFLCASYAASDMTLLESYCQQGNCEVFKNICIMTCCTPVLITESDMSRKEITSLNEFYCWLVLESPRVLSYRGIGILWLQSVLNRKREPYLQAARIQKQLEGKRADTIFVHMYTVVIVIIYNSSEDAYIMILNIYTRSSLR